MPLKRADGKYQLRMTAVRKAYADRDIRAVHALAKQFEDERISYGYKRPTLK